MTSILILLGSLSKESLNAKVASILVTHAQRHGIQSGYTVDIYQELANLPFYNQDLDTDTPPASVKQLRSHISAASLLLLISPEYNGSAPAVIKNAIDWASRPYGASALSGKPFALLGTSPGASGGQKALEQLRVSLAIAGGVFIEGGLLALSSSRFNGFHPKEVAEVVTLVDKFYDDIIK